MLSAKRNISFPKVLLLWFLTGIMVMLTASVSAQEEGERPTPARKDTVTLEGFISTDRTLSSGKVYKLPYNVKIGGNATLNVEPNVEILLDFNTAIVVEGGLNFNGSPNGRISVTSIDPRNPGIGILIRGDNEKNINIQHTRFYRISTPVKFDLEWYRPNVTIENNIFTELFTGESNILITNPIMDYDITSDKKIDFTFSNNSFVNNWGSIFIENFQDNMLDLKFTNNLITNNVVYGIEQGVPSNAPIFGLYDDTDSKYQATISGNSIFGNYQINSATDTIIREISFGVQGDGEVLSIPDNYYRSVDANYVSSTFDHFYQNSDLPLLKPEPILTEPKESVNPHIWKVKIDNAEVRDYGKIPNVERRDVPFEVYFNKPVEPFGEYQMESILYDTAANELIINPMELADQKWSADKKVFYFNLSNANFLRNKLGYIVLSNFRDNQGLAVPDFTIGQRTAINNYRRMENASIKSADIISGRSGIDVDIDRGAFLRDRESVKALKALTDLGDISYLGPYRSLAKTWEVGVLGGVTTYTGSLTHKFAERDELRFSVGIYGQYNAHQWFSLRAMLWWGEIKGEDITDPKQGDRNRLANFRNHIIEGSLTFHWHILKYGTNRGEKFTPSIFAGLAMFRNNPVTKMFLYYKEGTTIPIYLQYDGSKPEGQEWITDGSSGEDVWIPLQPIGTEGQTTGEIDQEFNRAAPKQYKKIQLAIPLGIELNWIIFNSWNIGAHFGYRFTSTRYLDDVGGYYFDRQNNHQAIVDANPVVYDKKGRALPDQITFTNDNDKVISYHPARILANPSLVQIEPNDLDPSIPYEGFPNHAYYIDETTENGGAVRAERNADNADSYFFFGLKVSKILKPRKDREKKEDVTIIKDNDDDGLSNDFEKEIGTDPKKADTDGDGLSDGKEVNELGTDPLKVDSDGDGIPDGEQYKEKEENEINENDENNNN